MSLELINTIEGLLTVLIIAATAIVAMVQLRHLRSANQIAAITRMQETLESAQFTNARRFVSDEVPKLIADRAGRSKLAASALPPELSALRQVGNFFESMGVLVKRDVIDRNLACDLWDGVVFHAWKQLEPVVLIRRAATFPGIWTSFEFLAVLCQESLEKTKGSYYPRGVKRMTVDEQSSAALAAFSQDGEQATRIATEQQG